MWDNSFIDTETPDERRGLSTLLDMALGEIAQLVGGQLHGDPALRITGLNGVQEAGPGEISFVRGGKFLQHVPTTRAAALLLAELPENCPAAVILVSQPDLAFAQLLQLTELQQLKHPQGIHPSAVVAPSAQLGTNVSLDACAVVAEDAVLGEDVVVYAGCYIGRGVIVGRGTILYPNVVLREGTELGERCIIHAGAVIGSDGFGFVPMGGRWIKVPQVGKVVLGNDVEIGSNTAIDRATCGVTQIGQGVKIDNLVQVGHNVRVGEYSVIAGTTGIAGSAVIGRHVRIGASAGIAGHLEIGDGATIGARAGVTKSVEPGKTVSGFPAMDHNVERRVMVAQQRVPELIRRVRELERQIQALEAHLHEQATNDR